MYQAAVSGTGLPSATATISVVGYDFPNIVTGGPITLGLMEPNGNAGLNANWAGATISMSTATLNNTDVWTALNSTIYDKRATFTHELGHALKLRHPHEIMSDWRPLSVMNQGLLSNIQDIPERPRGYDRYNLIQKW
jgi:hypothetical protein